MHFDRKDVEVVVDVARQAGELVRRMQEAGLRNVKSKTSAGDLVTEADVASERLLSYGAAKSFRGAAMNEQDMLKHMFDMQAQLNKRIGIDTAAGLSEEDQTKWVLNYCRAMAQEMAELTDSVPWKWWAKYQKFDQQNARVEVVDLFHFLISLAQVLGMSAEDVHRYYVEKNKVNFQRQDAGYTKKDEDDSRHIGA